MPFIPQISGRIKNASNSNTILLSTEIIAANLIGVSENLSNLSLGFMKYASGIRPPIDALKPVAIAAPAFYFSQLAQEQNTKYVNSPLSRVALAEYLSVNRSAMIRELSKMRDDGIIDFDKDTFIVKELNKSKVPSLP